MTAAKNTLEDWGYDSFFQSGRESLRLRNYSVARVVAEYRGVYRVRNNEGEFRAQITGKQMYTARKREDYPAVGDWVALDILPENKALIRGILPRKTILKKKQSGRHESQIIGTNIDTAFIVESMDRDYNLNRFERFVVLAVEANIVPVLILNKIDLLSRDELEARIRVIQNRFSSINIISTSTLTGGGIDSVLHFVRAGKTYCFLGSSGVGKSSLINRLLKKDEIPIREMSLVTGKGKHTTTSREMYFLENGGIVIDNPGTREVGTASSSTGIETVFGEMGSLSNECKYSDCTHTNEPGCIVLKALENEDLDRAKYDNYIKLKKEADFYKMTSVEKREKDKKFGKFIKKAKEALESNAV